MSVRRSGCSPATAAVASAAVAAPMIRNFFMILPPFSCPSDLEHPGHARTFDELLVAPTVHAVDQAAGGTAVERARVTPCRRAGRTADDAAADPGRRAAGRGADDAA